MPSLCIFLHDLSATGVVRNNLAIARHMARLGWDVRLILGRADGSMARDAEGIDTHVLQNGTRGSRSRSLDLLMTVSPLRHTLRRLQPDVCLSGGNHAHLPLMLAAAGMRRPARVYRISNDLDHGRPAYQPSPRRLAARWVIRDAAKLILVSPEMAGDPTFRQALSSGKAEVVPNGVDVANVRCRAADSSFVPPWDIEGDPVVLAAGRLVEQKNFGMLVEAASLANRSRPLRLVIIGRGSASARRKLVERAHACGLGDRLILPGVISNPFAAMHRAAVVALPSLWEGSPNVLLEAMAAGAPVVASHQAGNAAAILNEGQFGVLADAMTPRDIADALLTQLDPFRRIVPADRADCYDIANTLDACRTLFEQLASTVADVHLGRPREAEATAG